MISRRNYFAITIVMFIIFFMFLSTGVITEIWNDYETNSYSKDSRKLPGKSEVYSVSRGAKGEIPGHSRDFIVYVGGKEMEEAVEIWASYTKKNMEGYISLTQCGQAEWKEEHRIPSMLVIDSGHVRWEEGEELEYLEKCLEEGIDVVFCNMPDASVIKKSRRIQSLFGIRSVKAERTDVKGVHLYEGFLLGGEAVYLTADKKEQKKRQDMDLTLPWYELEAGTEVYMKGVTDEEVTESEEYPVIIWKKNYRGACLMTVNGRYMEDFGGIGILSAMVAQMELYDLYPVVNAQSIVVADYPVLAQENEEQLMDVYSRDMQGVERDVLWPEIMSVYRRNRMGLSCMMAPQLDYEDDLLPEREQLHYYVKNLNKEDTEVGLSGVSISDTQLRDKLSIDYDFIHGELPEYQFASFYAGSMNEDEIKATMAGEDMTSVRTVIEEDRRDDEIVGYLSEHVTKQKVLSDGFTHTYRDDLRIKCVETMLGYTNILIDVTDALYPKDKTDSWEKLAEDLGWNIRDYWKGFREFQGATASESDEYIRRFLALDYSRQRDGKDIRLQVFNVREPVWFILRTHNEAIDRMEGGSFTELEEDVFLLELEEEEAVITMKSTVLTYEY